MSQPTPLFTAEELHVLKSIENDFPRYDARAIALRGIIAKVSALAIPESAATPEAEGGTK